MLGAKIAERLSLWLSVSYGVLGKAEGVEALMRVLYMHRSVLIELEKNL